jgi:hypothetical protein
MKRVILILLCLLLLPSMATAGDGFFSDVGKAFTYPMRMDSRGWLTAGAVAAGTAVMYSQDQDVYEWVGKHRTDSSDNVSSAFESMGNAGVLVAGVGLTYLSGKLSDNDKATQTSVMAMEALTVSTVYTYALKFSTHRHRPIEGAQHDVWDGAAMRSENLSFSSGHSSAAFSVMTVFAHEYRDIKWVPYAAYGTAALTAISRVHDDKHWASDVFFGAAVGVFSARSVLDGHGEGDNKVVVLPMTISGLPGILATVSF